MNYDFFSFDAGEKIILTFLLKRRTKGKPDLKKIIINVLNNIIAYLHGE